MNSNYREREIFFLKETDLQYLFAEDFKPDPQLVKLFKSKSPWESDRAMPSASFAIASKSNSNKSKSDR